jgi:transcription initiation factor TFIID TATA-box-binding protein
MSSEIKIVNVVVSTKIGNDIDLEYVADILDNSEYEPEQFPGLVCRLSDPKVALLIFRSGKLNCTGAKSKEDAIIAINKVMGYLREAGLDLIDTPEVKVQNMVATAELGMEPNLDDLSTLERTEYEPEQFPGLVYRMESPKVVLLVFGSGKVVITGLKNKEDAYTALEKIKNTVKELEEEYF